MWKPISTALVLAAMLTACDVDEPDEEFEQEYAAEEELAEEPVAGEVPPETTDPTVGGARPETFERAAGTPGDTALGAPSAGDTALGVPRTPPPGGDTVAGAAGGARDVATGIVFAFDLIDANRDTRIDRPEFEAWWQQVDPFGRLDRDGDGSLTRAEVEAGLFELLDADGDGAITLREWTPRR
jgi:hypothetical protein